MPKRRNATAEKIHAEVPAEKIYAEVGALSKLPKLRRPDAAQLAVGAIKAALRRAHQGEPTHIHRRARPADFEGKTIRQFMPTADNIWQFEFTDGTKLAIQAEAYDGIGVLELCEDCG